MFSFPHPDVLAVDCRSIDWTAFGSLYLFPPTAMIPQLLHLILTCPAWMVVVLPWKPQEPWSPPLCLVSEGSGPSLPTYDTVPEDRRGDRLAVVRHLRTLDRPAFLRQVLSVRYPARVVDTLLASFRRSSHRQHDLAWQSFQAWLPPGTVDVSHVQVLEFLQHLFNEVGLSPCTVLCYRGALKWPLQEVKNYQC